MSPAAPDYFDAASGLPLHPVALDAWQAASDDGWADPARLTTAGRRSALLLDAAREAAAAELGIRPDELSFVPSGSHALQLGVLGTLAGRRRAGRTLVHSAVEHSAVFKAADWHVAHEGTVAVAPVDGTGRIDEIRFTELARRPGVAAAVLQAANHEVGTRQPVQAMVEELGDVPLVVDAGHELVYGAAPERAAVFTADARLWGGPGVGLLAVRRGTRWRAPFPTDESERGRGLGVPDVAAIVAAVASLRATRSDRAAEAARLRELVARVRDRVPRLVPDAEVLGAVDDRLPHLVTFSCLYVDGETLLDELGRHGFAVSSGSSCTSDTLTPSHVLVAMGALTSGNVRLSLHSAVSDAEIERFLCVLPDAVARVRAQAPGSPDVQPTISADTVVDSRGRRCPLPILDLARALPGIDIGAELTVLADDPAAAADIAAWCRMRGQQLVDTTAGDDGSAAYRVRRLG